MHNEKFRQGVPFGPATERAKKILMREDLRLLDEVKQIGGFEEYVAEQPRLVECFTEKKAFVCCMDERTAKGSIHVPGSGILIESGEAQLEYQKRLQAEDVQGVYSHANCGAVKLYAKEHGIANYEQAAIAYGRQLAQDLGVEYMGHIKTSGEHPGRVVYFDATGKIDTSSNTWQELMPTGFAVTRGALSPKEAMRSVILGVKIAFSEHGYGPNMFSEKDPMTLVVIGRDTQETMQLQLELQSELAQIVAAVPEAKGKIQVDGFTAPAEVEKTSRSAYQPEVTTEPEQPSA